MKKLLAIVLLGLLPLYAHAEESRDMAQDLAEHPMSPAVEKRLVNLSQKLRCLVCQNESLASSHAELAEDLRRQVREMMEKGMTDQQIIDYLVARYGDFVLYDPPVKETTMLLWYGPFALLLIGAGVLYYQLRKRRRIVPEIQLTPEAQQRAAALLNDEEDHQA
jgi:cytochrome c-type biogenesis protein CcmH